MLEQEGFALELSRSKLGRIAAGISNGSIYIYEPTDNNISGIVQTPNIIKTTNKSIGDLQFSPSQEDVLAACSSDGTIRIYDLRTPFNNISELKINAHECDVNVISWNSRANTLLASGADDGSFKVWDLRYVGKEAITNIMWHRDQITSIEWQPHDEWTLVVGSADNRISIWDLSVEKDDKEVFDVNLENVPDQLLFLHQGQENIKEIHWHPVYNNVIASTSLDSFNIFQPALDEEEISSDSPNDLQLIPDQV